MSIRVFEMLILTSLSLVILFNDVNYLTCLENAEKIIAVVSLVLFESTRISNSFVPTGIIHASKVTTGEDTMKANLLFFRFCCIFSALRLAPTGSNTSDTCSRKFHQTALRVLLRWLMHIELAQLVPTTF